MTERDYITATYLERVRVATEAVRKIIPGVSDGAVDQIAHRDMLGSLRDWEAILEKRAAGTASDGDEHSQ